MKLLGKVKAIQDGEMVLALDSLRDQVQAEGLDKEKSYTISINKVKSKRSLEQNRLLWALIGEIDQAISGRYADPWGIYIELLELAGAKSEVIIAPIAAERELKKSLRVVKLLRYAGDYKGIEMGEFRVFYGSSTFNTKEMTQLIDTALNYAENMDDIDTDYWRRVLGA